MLVSAISIAWSIYTAPYYDEETNTFIKKKKK